MFKLSSRSRERLEGVDEELVQVIELALSLTKIDFGIPPYGGMRNVAEQEYLFRTGKSKVDGKIKRSKHQEGKAFDVFAYVDGEASWDKEHLTHVAAAILQAASQLNVPLKWGGLFKNFIDMPHFERS